MEREDMVIKNEGTDVEVSHEVTLTGTSDETSLITAGLISYATNLRASRSKFCEPTLRKVEQLQRDIRNENITASGIIPAEHWSQTQAYRDAQYAKTHERIETVDQLRKNSAGTW
jgi:hypothetical protein